MDGATEGAAERDGKEQGPIKVKISRDDEDWWVPSAAGHTAISPTIKDDGRDQQQD